MVRKKTSTTKCELNPLNSFAIVIPAHNEEKSITETIASCIELNYPKDKYKVFVIADNCSDRTAEIAVKNGAVCLERYDNDRRGKGFALSWGFKQILPHGHDALIVLDADCCLEPCALRIIDYYLQQGNKVLQANYINSNPDDSAISYAICVGGGIEQELFYAPKSDLNLAVFLKGTGMVFQRKILERYPWHAYSVVEDAEYTLKLLREGIPISFIDEVLFKTKSPVQPEQLKVQRTRWASGNISFGNIYSLKLIWEGLVNKQWRVLDAGWTFLVLSRPLVLLEYVIAIGFASLCSWLYPGQISNICLLIVIVLFLFYMLYFVLGIILVGINPHRIILLLGSPVVVIRLILISLIGIYGNKKDLWIRTPR